MKKAKFDALEGVLPENILPILQEGDVGKILGVRADLSGFELTEFPEYEPEPNMVADRAALKALPTTTPAAVYLAEAGRQGIFVFRSGDYSAHVALDTLEGVYVKATDVAASGGCWVRHLNERQLLNIKWFGAVGDNVNNDRPAIDAAFALAKAYHGGLYLPKGLYSYDLGGAVATWDFSDVQYGFTIEGDGLSITEIRVINPTAVAGNLGINWVSSGPQYDKTIKGFTIRGEFNGCVLTIGKNDLTDSFETSYFERFGVINQHEGGAQSEALRLNPRLQCQQEVRPVRNTVSR